MAAFAAALHPRAGDLEADAEREKARKDAGVEALLFERYPIRHWDHYLGPRERHLLAVLPPEPRTTRAAAGGCPAPDLARTGREEMGFPTHARRERVVVARA